MAILDLMPTEEELIRRYELTVFNQKADWHLTDEGDLGETRDGDILVGSPSFNAMRRLVSGWRYNEPTMRMLFRLIKELRDSRPDIEKQVEASLREKARAMWSEPGLVIALQNIGMSDYHSAQEALDAGEIGASALSGSLMILVSLLLGRFRGDLKPTDEEWSGGRPAVHEVSVGRLATAAANAFRHADEWAEARHTGKFSRQQKISMDALDAALALDPFKFSDMSLWEHALDAITKGDFDGLAGDILRFGNNVAETVQNRLTPFP